MKQTVIHPYFWQRVQLTIAAWLVTQVSEQDNFSGTFRLHAGDVTREIEGFRDLYYPAAEIRKFP